MCGFQVFSLLCLLSKELTANADADVVIEATTVINKPVISNDEDKTPALISSDAVGTGAPNWPPNLFTQFSRPLKTSGKTYGPNIIAVIGDKPYISMEVFQKFSPLKWLMNAFQGKIQNICGILAPPEPSFHNPQNVFEQLTEQSPKPSAGLAQAISGSGPIGIYDIPATYKSGKRRTYN